MNYTVKIFLSLTTIITTECQLSLPLASKKGERPRYPLSQGLISKAETNKFTVYALEKMGKINCLTMVVDNRRAHIIDALSDCVPSIHACSAYKYLINIDAEQRIDPTLKNLSKPILEAFQAGYERKCRGYIILLKTPSAVLGFLKQADDQKLIHFRARMLIWYEDNDRDFEMNEIWKKLPNVVLFHSKTKKRQMGVLFTIRGLKWPVIVNSTEARTHLIEFWGQGHSEEHQEWFREKTTDLKNTTIKISVVEHPPAVIKYTKASGEVEFAGTEVEIVKVLASIMNFNYNFIDADYASKWGGQLGNNSEGYFGAVANLIYGETDMAIGSFFILQHYLTKLDMSVPLEVACTSFLLPNPLARPRYLALILPFRPELWILVLVICFIVGPLGLYLSTRQTEYKVFSERAQVVFTSFRLMLQVALDIWPKFWPARLYIGWYWLFWLLISLAYRAAIVSFLTIPLFEKPINNLKDLSESGLRIGGWGIELRRLFTQVSIVESQERASFSDRYEIVDDLDDAIGLVAEGKFALYENLRFLKFVRMTKNLTRVGSPTMRVMKQCVVPVHIGFAFQKHSPIVHTINRHVRRFQESGLSARWGQRLVAVTREFNRIKDQGEESEGTLDEKYEDNELANDASDLNKSQKQNVLKLMDMQGSMYVLLLGTALSSIAFILELCVFKYRKVQNRYMVQKLHTQSLLAVKGKKQYLQHGNPIAGSVKKRKTKPAKTSILYPYLE